MIVTSFLSVLFFRSKILQIKSLKKKKAKEKVISASPAHIPKKVTSRVNIMLVFDTFCVYKTKRGPAEFEQQITKCINFKKKNI